MISSRKKNYHKTKVTSNQKKITVKTEDSKVIFFSCTSEKCFAYFFPLLTYFVEALKTNPYSSKIQKYSYKWGEYLFEIVDSFEIKCYFKQTLAPLYFTLKNRMRFSFLLFFNQVRP